MPYGCTRIQYITVYEKMMIMEQRDDFFFFFLYWSKYVGACQASPTALCCLWLENNKVP